MLFALVGFLFTLFANAALVGGFAVLVLARRKSPDCSSVLPFAAFPLVPLGLLTLYTFGAEVFTAYYGGNKYEADAMHLRIFGPYSAAYFLNLIAAFSTQIFWIPKFRRSATACFMVGLLNLFP